MASFGISASETFPSIRTARSDDDWGDSSVFTQYFIDMRYREIMADLDEVDRMMAGFPASTPPQEGMCSSDVDFVLCASISLTHLRSYHLDELIPEESRSSQQSITNSASSRANFVFAFKRAKATAVHWCKQATRRVQVQRRETRASSDALRAEEAEYEREVKRWTENRRRVGVIRSANRIPQY